MRIDSKNKKIIDKEIYVHDSTFYGFLYDNDEKTLLLKLKNYYLQKTFKLKFVNILALNCEMCQFWSYTNGILGWETVDEEQLKKQILEEQKENILELENYIETKFILETGDIITIVCEYVEFFEINWNDNIKNER